MTIHSVRGLALAIGLFASVVSAADPDPKQLRSFLDKHCTECHGPDVQKGNTRLDQLTFDVAKPAELARWQNIWNRIHAKEMPPAKHAQLTDAERLTLLRSLAGGLEARRTASGVRRLSRAEFEYSLRDLFDLPALDVREMLPPDGEVGGFDKVSEALGLSHAQLTGYMTAIDDALDQATAIALRPERPMVKTTRLRPQDEFTWQNRAQGGQVVVLGPDGPDPVYNPATGKLNISKREDLAKKDPIYAFGSLFHYDAAGRLLFNETRKLPALAGLYRVRFSVYTFEWDRGKVLPAKASRPFRLSTSSRLLGYFDAPPDQPSTIEITTWIEPHDLIHFNPVSLPHGVGLDKEGAKGWKGGGVAIQWLELEGPLQPEGPLPVRSLLYGDLPTTKWTAESKLRKPSRKRHKLAWWVPEPPLHTVTSKQPLEDAERLLMGFMRRAYRRPVTRDEIAPFVAIVRRSLDTQATLEEALRAAYKSVLLSPDFLFINTVDPTCDDALASRLSYFLWCSLPDEELLRVASTGKLRQPEVLAAQTKRLLADPKAKRFKEDFADQWLKLHRITATSPDPQLYPPTQEQESDVAPYLWDSMVGESRAFLAELLNDNLPVKNVIHSDFVMLNDIMARHYRFSAIVGSQFRRVPLKPDSHRGGFLTQAAILKVSANGTVTSPVTRGAWVMANLLDQQPPPPPESVAAIDPDVRGTTTIRERLAKHREHASCAQCHARFDPAGFALENYDVLGHWRERYRIVRDNKMDVNGPQVDASGTLADGRIFRDIEEFKKLLLADERRVAQALASKFFTYAVGRRPSPTDRLELDTMIDAHRPTSYGVRSLLEGVIQSNAFRRN